MISIPSTSRTLGRHAPLLSTISTESSCHPSSELSIITDIAAMNTLSNIGTSFHHKKSNGSDDGTNHDSSNSSKRPKHYLLHSQYSSRHIQLTDDATPREMVVSMIQAQYHIYHTDLSGYLAGGAMVQDALTTFALGGSPRDLFQIYKKFRPDKERIPPTPTVHINSRNWKDWLGHKSYYHDYLDFFDRELRLLETKSPIHLTTPQQTVSGSWPIVPEYLAPLIPGLCAAAGPLIHLGYGIEFGSRLAIAEGLAYACISFQSTSTCFIPNSMPSCWPHSDESKNNGITGDIFTQRKRSPGSSILNMIRNDKRLDGMFDAGFQGKLNVVMSSRVSLLKSYLAMWATQIQSVSEALLDLSRTTTLLLFTGTNRFGDEQQLDKNLANVLLTTHAARFLVKVLPTDKQKEQLLKAIWMSLVATYVVQGRPKLAACRTTTTLPAMSRAAPQEKDNGDSADAMVPNAAAMGYFDSDIPIRPCGRWKSLCQEAIQAEYPLVPKIVRALWWAELEHGDCADLFYDSALRVLSEDATSDESTGPGI